MTCPLCGGPLGYLGQLGDRIHYRCRDCGADSSELANDDEGDEEGGSR
jgi:hypothetical protein